VGLRYRRARRRRNPGAAAWTLIASGGLIVASILVIRHVLGRGEKMALKTPPLDMSKPDVRQLEGNYL
jgi:hypothetical protein